MAKRKTGQVSASVEDPSPTLTWQEERFVEQYIRHGNATQAYHSVYGGKRTSARELGSRMLRKVDILDAIERAKEQDREMLQFTRHDALKVLIGMAGASLDDFAPVFADVSDRENYRGLGYKRFAIESGKKNIVRQKDGFETETSEVKIISPSERRAAINDLWEKLGLGQDSGNGNWFDGLAELADFVRTTKGAK